MSTGTASYILTDHDIGPLQPPTPDVTPTTTPDLTPSEPAPVSVEVETIPSLRSPIDSADYYDFNTEDYSTILDSDCHMEQLSQLRCKGSRRCRKLYECSAPGCNKAYNKPALLTYHMDTAHLNLKWFTCIYKNCDKSFYHPSQMKRHLRTHGPKQYYCELCYNTFGRLENLKVHQRKCRLLLMCSVCGETFLTSSDIQKHRQAHCVYLKCLYKDCYEHLAPETIREHLAQHVSVVKCPLCVGMYLEQSNLEKHMLSDHKTAMCDTADYASDVDVDSWFRNVFSDLDKQEEDANNNEIDVSENPSVISAAANKEVKAEDAVLYTCTEPGCDYATPTPRWLTRHKLKHKKQGTFKCGVCHKILADKWGLSLHMSTHSIGKNYPCTYCNKTYSSQSRLSEHCQNYHAESRVWVCQECNQGFSTSKRLMTHYKKHVTGEYLIKKP